MDCSFLLLLTTIIYTICSECMLLELPRTQHLQHKPFDFIQFLLKANKKLNRGAYILTRWLGSSLQFHFPCWSKITTCTLVPWRQGCTHHTRNHCTGWFALLALMIYVCKDYLMRGGGRDYNIMTYNENVLSIHGSSWKYFQDNFSRSFWNTLHSLLTRLSNEVWFFPRFDPYVRDPWVSS